MINCNGNYTGIGIGITKNTKCGNVIFITIYFFDDNTIIKSEDNEIKAF